MSTITITEVIKSRGDDPESRRWQDPDQLICPGCDEQVRPEPPGYWRVADGLPAPQFSHQDATALCAGPDGRPGEPKTTSLQPRTDRRNVRSHQAHGVARRNALGPASESCDW
jgi:hypothetical protein